MRLKGLGRKEPEKSSKVPKQYKQKENHTRANYNQTVKTNDKQNILKAAGG